MSIKPVAWMKNAKQGQHTSLIFTGFETEGFEPLYAIPDTHRVVSVEDLKSLEDKLDFWISMSEQEYKTWLALGHQSKTARRLRAIIEDKP